MTKYITGATTTQVATNAIKHVVITVNTALTGTITVIDGTAGTTANVAIITNPTVGLVLHYYDFQLGVRIVTIATCDIAVAALGTYGGGA